MNYHFCGVFVNSPIEFSFTVTKALQPADISNSLGKTESRSHPLKPERGFKLAL